ncbi:YcjF family protein [Kineobactrum salinum]|uniref:Kinase n=1 Tax=Kineobactrum salinum TaxID=2708301 RepID=A0A6C0UAV0_9GAMM|nr:GTPase [Kineobactrum salinum]QIB67044.1 kinase [Kineobactrum salinum]
MKDIAAKLYNHILNPPADAELARAREMAGSQLPTIWLLGKTGAGKTSIVRQLTGHSRAEIGNGFQPCTSNSSRYDYPPEHPVVRFLDTRGLGEASYDADEDLRLLGEGSHALFVVLRLRDAERSATLQALTQIRRHARHIQPGHIAVIHTAVLEVTDAHDRQRAVAAAQQAVEQAWGGPVAHCEVDFPEPERGDEYPDTVGAEELAGLIAAKVPELRLWLREQAGAAGARSSFRRLSGEILWYAGAAAASDAIPLVGLVSVPAVQGKMLHSLAQKYGVSWSRRNVSEFVSALGTLFTLRYLVSLGGRQLGKLIPGFGQLAGSAFAASVSYASTYALGRAACSYLYHKQADIPLDDGSIRQVYQRAMKEGRDARRQPRD